jgi:hypothetical protein
MMKSLPELAMISSDPEEEKLLKAVEEAIMGGMTRDTLTNNGKSFDYENSIQGYDLFFKTNLFQQIVLMK